MISANSAARAGADPIEGKWYGEAGSPLDRIEVGFEFKRGEKGELKAYMYEPVCNFYGMEMQGAVRRVGEKYFIDQMLITLELKDGKLQGTYILPSSPIVLERTEKLPSEVPVPDLPRGPGPKWLAKLGGSICAAVAVRDGVAYVGTTGGIFNAINVRDGSFVWMFAAGRPIHGDALTTDRHVYFVCDNGYLFKLDRKTGKEVWRYDLGDERINRQLGHQIIVKLDIGKFDFDYRAPCPLLVDGVIYVCSGDGSLHAVDAESAKRVWRFEGKGKGRSSAVLDRSNLIFGTYTGMLYAVDRRTGKEVWNKATLAEITSPPAMVGDKLIVGNRGGLLAAFDPATGKTAWRMVLWGSSVESTATPGDGSLFYIGSSDLRRISLMDAKDGRVLWRTDIFGCAWARPTVTKDIVYASAVGMNPYITVRHLGSLNALDRATGKIIWRWPAPESAALYNGFVAQPIVADNLVIVGALDGNLYAFPTT
jgi:outer membrane protein assembly factor BamB